MLGLENHRRFPRIVEVFRAARVAEEAGRDVAPVIAVRTRTLVSAPGTFKCGASAVVNTSPVAAVDRPTNSSWCKAGRRIVNGCVPDHSAFGIVATRSWFAFDVGPETTTLSAATSFASTGSPASSVIVNTTWIFSPASTVPFPSEAPASPTDAIEKCNPWLVRWSRSGCRCEPSTVSPPLEQCASKGLWHSLHRLLSACANMPAGGAFGM